MSKRSLKKLKKQINWFQQYSETFVPEELIDNALKYLIDRGFSFKTIMKNASYIYDFLEYSYDFGLNKHITGEE